MGMAAVVGAAMVLAAAATLGCVLTTRPRHPGVVLSTVVMLVAMIDMALGHLLLAPLWWGTLLVALGVFVAARPAAADARCRWRHGIALVAGGVIMFGSPHGLPVADQVGMTSAHIGHLAAGPVAAGPVAGGPLPGIFVTVGYLVVAWTDGRRSSEVDKGRIQVISTAACLLLMALLPLVS